jgi:hypothetical protein
VLFKLDFSKQESREKGAIFEKRARVRERESERLKREQTLVKMPNKIVQKGRF